MHSVPYFTHLARQGLFHLVAPYETARAIFVWASFEARQLLSPFADQRIQPDQFGLKLCRL